MPKKAAQTLLCTIKVVIFWQNNFSKEHFEKIRNTTARGRAPAEDQSQQQPQLTRSSTGSAVFPWERPAQTKSLSKNVNKATVAKIIIFFQLLETQLLQDTSMSPCTPIRCNIQLIKSSSLANVIENGNDGNFQQVAASAESSRFSTDT